MSSTQRWLLLLTLLMLGGALLWVTVPPNLLDPFLEAETWREWREWIRDFGVLAPLVSIGVSTAQVVPLPIPAPVIPLANGWLFGIWGGTVVTWVGVMLNSLAGYWLARGPGRRILLRFVSGSHLQRAEGIVESYGALAVVTARLFPVLPFSAISVAAGLLHMRVRDYLLATALGVLPSAFALALIGWQLSRGALDWRQVAIGAGILIFLAIVGVRLSRWFRGVE